MTAPRDGSQTRAVGGTFVGGTARHGRSTSDGAATTSTNPAVTRRRCYRCSGSRSSSLTCASGVDDVSLQCGGEGFCGGQLLAQLPNFLRGGGGEECDSLAQVGAFVGVERGVVQAI